MRLLLLCAALGYVHACSTSGGVPCDGYIQAKVTVDVVGAADDCAQTGMYIGETFAGFLNLAAEQVSLADQVCDARRRRLVDNTYTFDILNLDTDQYQALKDIQADESDFASALRAKTSFDDVVVTVDMETGSDLPCGGKALYYGSKKFDKGTDQTNKKPVYVDNNGDFIFYKNGEWVIQLGGADPQPYTAICSPVLDNIGIDDCDGYDEYFFEMQNTITQLETDLQTCQANGGGAVNCSDELRTPIFVDGEWWYCDELIKSDCTDSSHGEAVRNHCPGTCGTCGQQAVQAVCGEKYHTKVFIPGIGSLYCDQLYPEECQEAGVSETCCQTCV